MKGRRDVLTKINKLAYCKELIFGILASNVFRIENVKN